MKDIVLGFVRKAFEIGFTKNYMKELMDLIQQGAMVDNGISDTISEALIPIALSLISLFWILELLNKTIRFKGTGLSWEHMMMLAVKLILAVGIVKSSPTIIKVIVEIGDSTLSAVGGVATNLGEIQFNGLWEEIESMGVIEQLIAMFQLLPLGIISLIISIGVRIAIYGRAIKLIIFSALSPLPMSTIMFDEQRDVGKRFIQSFLGASLQGAIIIIAILLSQQLHSITFIGTESLDVVSSLADVPGLFTRYVFINGVLMLVLFKSESWALAVTGTN